VTGSAASCQVPGQPDAWAVGAYRNLELSNAGSSMLRWALDIRPGSKWLESKAERLPKDGFRLRAWNRLPQAKPTIKVAAGDVGLKGETDVLHAQLNGPAFRLPAEIEVVPSADKVTLKVSKPAKVRLYYRLLRPDWPATDKLLLQRRRPGEAAEVVRGEVVREKDYIEWRPRRASMTCCRAGSDGGAPASSPGLRVCFSRGYPGITLAGFLSSATDTRSG
jgi:hypothetical protein